MSVPEWSSNFFDGLVVESLRRMNNEAQTQAEADYLVRMLQPAAGAHIADIPCGNRRLSLAPARRGYRVTGVDISGDLLEAARRATDGLHATFEQWDMRALPWVATFDHAFCFGNSFAYFDDAGNLAFLQAINAALKPGGRFVLETHFVMESLLPHPLGKRWYPFGDLLFLHDPAYDPATSRLTSSYPLIERGKVERNEAVYRLDTCRDILELFETAGFVEVTAHGSLKGDPIQLGSSGLWLTGRRA